ncbi:uncharacterized protein M421DRAFT_102624 [Didymella exigua CBS 183.55]|uniref:Uncharacterized protein n=1 Tax=Didymella exigua CBS 183.55 TaxID=1150837 RepID=A0A6A5RIL0_9PLEO|nr:uncharacterized protein M421DRAFT_102624 [Didymella exigua CBS 183.55]KAF1926286.1 hypothetical protein M421DRAFT_102624 [Didymella exigua CBS 183.55]
MISTRAASSRALSCAPRRVKCPTARRQYGTDYEQRTKEILKTSSRLTCASSSNASLATGSSSASSSTSNSSDLKPGHRHEAAYASDVPKPVEDRHGDTVNKHSIAARRNQEMVRVGKFSGQEFDNHELKHTPGKPGGDFEKKN